MGKKKLKVFLIDDHALFRSGVRALLSRQDDFEVVGEAADGLEGVKRVKQLDPDIVLMDLHMPGLDGRQALRMVGEESPRSKVIMLTVSEDSEDLLATLRAGAAGYLLKNIEADFLVDALRRVAAGESCMSPQMTGKLVQGVQQGLTAVEREEPSHEKLSVREREILGLIAGGASNKEIARTLDLAESTVKIHVQHILKKLGMTSRVQAAVYAVAHGMGQ